MSDALDDCRPDFVVTCSPAHIDKLQALFCTLTSGFGDMSAFQFQCLVGNFDECKVASLHGDWTPCRLAGDVLVALGYTVVCGEGV